MHDVLILRNMVAVGPEEQGTVFGVLNLRFPERRAERRFGGPVSRFRPEQRPSQACAADSTAWATRVTTAGLNTDGMM